MLNLLCLFRQDKAVNPANLMGATKRLAELSLQAFQDDNNNNTIFSKELGLEICFKFIRFSSTSFWEQISNGGPVTVTHEDVNRFFGDNKRGSEFGFAIRSNGKRR